MEQKTYPAMVFYHRAPRIIFFYVLLYISYTTSAQDFQDTLIFEEDPFNEMNVSIPDNGTETDSYDLQVESAIITETTADTAFIDSGSGYIQTETKKTADTIRDEANLTASLEKKESATAKNIRFYQKWWFTLILILLVSPFAYKFHLDIVEKIKDREKEVKKQYKELQSLLKEREMEFEKKELEYKDKFEKEEELKFQAVGLSKFSDIISKNKEDLKKLGQHLIYELVGYISGNSGVIYLLNEDKNTLQVLNSYAADQTKIKSTFKPGEGYIGTCFNEGKTLELENIPDSYTKIESGLGKSSPKNIVFIPLVQDENKLGVIEIASFHKLEKYKIEFIEKLAYNIASAIAIQSATDKMKLMLEQSEAQTEELHAQEEELRQNMEEMQSVQEELQRQKDELAQEKALMDTLLINAKESIYFKDKESRFIKASNSMAKLFKVKKVENLYGKNDFDFFTEEHAKPAFEDEMNIIKTGKPILDKREKETHADGRITWVTTSKMPLYNEKGEIVGTFGISKDITRAVEMEQEVNQRNEELQAQEEELRQNLEEMQAVQDELERQKKELSQEKALMDTLLMNAKESIYFKDKESRFIKASNSMAKLFKVKKVENMYGKNDFDFFTEEHARPAFEDEMNIIKTGKPIIDKLEKETHADGRITWVSTSKMPLYNEKGEIVGTYGISKDVTKSKEMEMEIKQRNEELQAQEEELRQNLEEMQTVQEELERQKNKLSQEKALMDTLLDNAKESIYFKDKESRFIKVSKSMAKLFKVKKVEDLYGKSDFDFFTEEHARPAFEDEMNIIKTGKPIIDKLEKETHADGRITWVSTSKMPLYNEKGEIIGTYGISKDVTKTMEMEMEIKQRNEELLAQEEELRQNLEEMQTIQEDLQKRIAENEKIRSEYEKRESELKKTIQKLQKK
ncbi:MAG: PAS domain-containing protein [Bacteroidales bacterium]|nr:PAS domain-containing protein [Bacteroidales bacterium]